MKLRGAEYIVKSCVGRKEGGKSDQLVIRCGISMSCDDRYRRTEKRQ
jgi:hypothetical protein